MTEKAEKDPALQGIRNISRWFYVAIGLVMFFLFAQYILFQEHENLSGSIRDYTYIISDILFSISMLILLLLSVLTFKPIIKDISSALSLTNLLKSIATTANESDSLKEGLQLAIDNICEYTGWKVGHVYIYSEDSKTLVSADVWHSASIHDYAEFIKASGQVTYKPWEGFIGEVYADATPMWILDVTQSGVFNRKDVAASTGLKTAFAFPIFVGRKAVAVMEFYDNRPIIPSETILSVMANVGKQLGQTIERAQFKQKAKLLETVISSANDGIIITKANLDSTGPEIIYVNQAFTSVTGYQPSEVIGKSPKLLQGEGTDKETLSEIRMHLEQGIPFKGELLNYNKNGNPYWLDIGIVPVRNEQGIITHFAAIERDITQRKASEAELKQTLQQLKRANLVAEAAALDLKESLVKAEEASKAKGDFLANMSHELRTPMNGVLGMANLLSDTILDKEQKEYVTTINDSAESLLVLLNDILDFSKIEANALVLEHIAFDLSESIYKTASLLKTNADKKNIDFIVDCEDGIPKYMMGDPGRLRQIITNLVGNAIKFTEIGYVRLYARVQEIDGTDNLYISIEDTGVGIPSHKQSEIFQKFTQADTSVTRKYGGTGLGLAITKQLVYMMGGQIGVESVEGKGSTFWFSIPCKEAAFCDVATTSQISESKIIRTKFIPAAEAKVLLVEDFHVNRVFAEKLLKKFGFVNIGVAENGSHALQKYCSHNYDAIFMDCQMPELDGYQASTKIREMEKGTNKHIPIIAMTANAMVGDREKCLNSGMDDYISKPLRAEHLKAILQNIFILDAQDNLSNRQKMLSTGNLKAEEPPVDIEQLRMFTDGDKNEELALFQLFYDQANEMITKMSDNIADDKTLAWKSAAHCLKGSSGNLGAMKLHHICKKAEMHFEDPANKKLEFLEAIKAETSKIQQFFQPIAV